jgi:diguanylate cyclase (GGDEF)-like protein
LEKQLRVLVAEDSGGEAIAALRTLYPEESGRLELTDIGSLSTLLPTMLMMNPDVVLLDLRLARPDRVEEVRRLHRAAPEVPIIVLADSTEKEEAGRCLEVGAIEYLLKGFMDARTVERALRVALERNTLTVLTDMMRDSTTGLHARDALLTLGSRALQAAQRNNGTLVLLCVLIENLKSTRAALGSTVAEQTLRDLAGLIQGSFRRSDVIARIGEEQFAALAVDAAEPSAPVLRQRVQRRVDTLNQLRDPASRMRLRMAVGYWRAEDTGTFSNFLDRVEAELRMAPVPESHDEELANERSH